uniref:hypothetical protein n=1 Tax=Nonomuraea sp. CA-251285 TaxID=3240002 RepID=UPI003F49A665
MARPTKLTRALAEEIAELVRDGNFLTTAAARAGIHRDTIYDWLNTGQADDAPKLVREFSDMLTRARAQAEITAVAAVFADMKGGQMVEETVVDEDGGRVTRKYTPPNGTVALKYLQRAFPSSWADRKPLEAATGEEAEAGMGGASTLTALTERLHAELQAVEAEPVVEGEIVSDNLPPHPA